MQDPLEAFEESLAYMFELQTRKTGKYINPAVQRLKQALDDYKSELSLSPLDLVRAFKRALPVIEKYVDSYVVKLRMEALAKANGLNVAWDIPHTRRRAYPHFHNQSILKTPMDFISWLSSCSNLEFSHLDRRKQAEILLFYRSERDFMTRLTEYLRDHPHFLRNLILESSDIFIEFLQTCLGFQLSNKEVAQAIAYHSLSMISAKSPEEIYYLTNFWDEYLVMTGRSIGKLMQDEQAKLELEKLEILESYSNQNGLISR
jgi:hypothetical protein